MDILPVKIEKGSVKLYGILNLEKSSSKIVIFVPAPTGTRIGPQRIFVEIANEINKLNYSTLRIDLPFMGDSIDPEQNPEYSDVFEYYSKYLILVHDFLLEKFQFNHFSILTISFGCMPLIYFARLHKYENIILLSPNPIESKLKPLVNKKNIAAYSKKILRIETWKKLLSKNIKFGSVFRNLYYKGNSGITKFKEAENSNIELDKDINVLCVFGNNDELLEVYKSSWMAYFERERMKNCFFEFVDNADHSFFRWSLKKQVIKYVKDWLERV